MTRSSRKRAMNEDAQQDSSGSTPRGKGAQQQSLGAFFSVKKSKASSNVAANAAKVQWREVGGTWIGKWGDPAPSAKFAAFDFDYTLVCVKGRGRFPRNSDDWRFFHAEVPQVLRRMHQQGYRIVIISNQNGLKPGKKDVGMSKKAVEYREKIAKVAKQLDVPFTILAAIAKDYMRKPSPGMWRLAELDNGGIAVDASSSFYVGDAAGRPAGWKPGVEADFSDSDLAFALNAGVSFYTPEEVFTEEICAKAEPLPLPAARTWTANRFTPKLLTPDHDSHANLVAAIEKQVNDAKDAKRGLLVMLVGPPACGKSTFTLKHLVPLGCERVNMDELKTRKKCDDALRQILKANGCAVIDNTNPDATARGSFIEIANESGATCVAVVFAHESRDLAMHNNNFRAQLVQARYFAACNQDADLDSILDGVPTCNDRVPEVAYHSFFKRFAVPELSEGFSEVLHHTFVPAFDSTDDELLWHQYN